MVSGRHLKTLRSIVKQIRIKFEEKSVEQQKIKKLYLSYNFVENVDLFVDLALNMFPKLNCGLASVYIGLLNKPWSLELEF